MIDGTDSAATATDTRPDPSPAGTATGPAHPFLRGPEIADRLAGLLQTISSRSSEIAADIAREAQVAADDDIARRLGVLLARWSATAGAYEQASMGLQLWASAAAVPTDGSGGRGVPEDTVRLTRAAVERLESTALTPRVIGVREDQVAAAPLLDAAAGSAGPASVTVGSRDHVVSLRAAGPYPGHLQDDIERLADQYVSQSRGAVSLGVARRTPVPMTVTVLAEPPADARGEHGEGDGPGPHVTREADGRPTEPDDPRWDHVVEGSVVAPEGLLVVEGGGTPVLRVQVPIGVWRVRAYSEGRGTVVGEGLDGEDAYHLLLWRGRSLPDALVLKQWPRDVE